MTDEQKALAPVDERVVDFYGDELTAVLVREAEREEIYVPVRPIADYLGLTWSSQYMRLQRDRILGEAIRGGGRQEMVALPLKFIPGWLFGISVNRVREELRDRILRYQRECYDVLWEAFQEGRLTASEDFESLLRQADPDVVHAYQIAQAVVRMARNQILLEARLTGRLDDHERRLETVESTLGDPGRAITPAQAARISQAVKAIALELGKKSQRNEFGGVYGEFYRRFEIPGYRELPVHRFEEAMEFMTEWWRELTGSDKVPF